MHTIVKIMAYEIWQGAVVVHSSFDESHDDHRSRSCVFERYRDGSNGQIYIKLENDGPSQFFEPGDHLTVDLTQTFFPNSC